MDAVGKGSLRDSSSPRTQKNPCAKAPNELQGPNSVEMCAWDDLHEGPESEADVHRWHQWDRQWRNSDSLGPKLRSPTTDAGGGSG